MIDVHCHIDYVENPFEVLEEARKRMRAVITSVADPKESKKVFQLAESFPNFLFVSLGFHPECLKDYGEKEIKEYIQFIKENKEKICAIGEVGMDFSFNCQEIDKKLMEETFVSFIGLARELNLPLVVHSREAMDKTLEILEREKAKNVCLHCFSGSETNLKKALSLGYYISFATNICYTKKHPRLAEKTPLERMLLETDSPWLDPDSPKTMTNHPWKIEKSAKLIGEIKHISIEKIKETTAQNAILLFNLKKI